MELNQPPLPTEIDDDAYHKPSFNDLGLKESVLKSVYEAGFTSPSPIQEKCHSGCFARSRCHRASPNRHRKNRRFRSAYYQQP